MKNTEIIKTNALIAAYSAKEKKDVLVPTCGIGDYLYYSLWISGIHTVSNSIKAYPREIPLTSSRKMNPL